jgi:aromatase
MGHTVNSVVINAPYELVFDISNKIERWTELFGKEYAKADVLEHKGNEITFRLTDEDAKSWVSKRWLFKDLKFAYAQRWDPLFPFKYMKIVWYYTELEKGDSPLENNDKGQSPFSKGIKMSWIQDFEMDPKFTKFSAEQIEGFINKHSQDNMKIFKQVIEAEALATK